MLRCSPLRLSGPRRGSMTRRTRPCSSRWARRRAGKGSPRPSSFQGQRPCRISLRNLRARLVRSSQHRCAADRRNPPRRTPRARTHRCRTRGSSSSRRSSLRRPTHRPRPPRRDRSRGRPAPRRCPAFSAVSPGRAFWVKAPRVLSSESAPSPSWATTRR